MNSVSTLTVYPAAGDERGMHTYEAFLSGRGFAATTIHARTKFHRNRLRAWSTMDVPPDRIARFLAGHHGWTRHTYHSHLTSIYEWMVEAGAAPANPMHGIRKPPVPRPRPRPLTEDELARALAAATPRTRAFLTLGYLAGLRASEIAKFHGDDIDEVRLRVIGKGGSVESLPTHPLLWTLAQSYPREGYWFPPRFGGWDHVAAGTVSDACGRLFRSLGIKGATHRARHTYGTHLLRGGANLRVVQELLRHRSLATTALYLGVDEHERVAAIASLAA